MGVNARRRQLAPEPYSLGHLRVLFERLIDAQEGRGEGETTVVETLRAISEVVVYGENLDAKVAAKAAKAAKAEAMRQSQEAGDSSPNGDAGKGGQVGGNAAGAGAGAAAVAREGTADIRRQDAFFELFCEKNMMSRFIELLRSSPSRYESSGAVPRSSSKAFGAPAWGTNGGLDAVVRALTWGGDVLGIGQQQQHQVQWEQGRSGSRGASRGRLMPLEGGSAEGSRERSSAEVQVQVIQTTSILVMNVKSDTSLFYLLSNNHVNDMIMFDFRLEDEEVLSHFASFLKTLSLRLNPNTVQFFLRGPRRGRHRNNPTGREENLYSNGGEEIRNDDDTEDNCDRGKAGATGRGKGSEAAGGGGQESSKPKEADKNQHQEHDLEEEQEATFPLYTRALEYICHSDFHVRIAALTVVLNIYKQRDPLVRAYLNGPAARSASLPDRLVGALRSQCLVLADRAMTAEMTPRIMAPTGASGNISSSKSVAAMAFVDPGICRDSIAGLQDQVFYLEDVFSSGQGELNAQLCEALLRRLVRPMLLGDWLSGRSGAMFPQVALCALAQLFIVVTYPPLVRLLVLETLGSEANGSCPPLLALLQGDREELCLGALVVIQALAQNRVVRVDLGLAHDLDDHDAGGLSVFDHSETLGEEGVEGVVACLAAPGKGGRCSRAGDVEMLPLGTEILGSTVDAVCRMLAPGDNSSSSDAASVAVAGPRRHHLVLRLCGKVLASLAPPPSTAPDHGPGNVNVNTNVDVNVRESAAKAATGEVPAIDEQRRAGGMEKSVMRRNLALDDSEAEGSASFARREAAAAADGRALRNASGLRETVLRRIGEAHSSAAAMVLRGLGEAEGASYIVVFKEEIREWSKRTDLDGAITNLPKMSSLILRWSLDNTSVSQRYQSPGDCRPPLGASAQGARVEESEAMRRQRELRGSLQAFLEIRQVRRLLSGKGEIDPSVLRIAGLGPEAEDEPKEGGSLDLGGRECLACSIPNPAPRLPAAAAGEDGRAEKVRKRRNGGAAALSVTTVAGRRGRSELYLVLDAKAFLLATPDRRRLSNGEVRSAAPLIHLAAAPDPADETHLHIRALSDRPVALMRPVTPPRLLKSTTSAGKPGAVSSSESQGGKAAARVKAGGSESPRDGSVATAEGGDAGSMCDMQAWACELVFENARSCRLARKHMEGRRLRLRSEKMKLITDLLEACAQGTDD